MAELPKLFFSANLLRVKCEFTRALVLQHKSVPLDLIDRAKTKLAQLAASNQIGFYLVFEDRLKEVWQAVLSSTDEPLDQKIVLTVAAGAPVYGAMRVEKSSSDKSTAVLSVDIPQKQTEDWRYEWFKLNIVRALRGLGITEAVSNAQVFGAFLRITAKGEILKNYQLTSMSQFKSVQQDKKIAIIANKQRREIAVILRDVRELRQKQGMEGMLAMIDQAVKQLNTDEVRYKVLKKDLSAALTSTFEGPEIVGVDLPATLLVAVGEAQIQTESNADTKVDAIYPGAGELKLACSPDHQIVLIEEFDKSLYKNKTFQVSSEWIRKELARCNYKGVLTTETLEDLATSIEKQESLEQKVLLKGTVSVGGKEPYIKLTFKEAMGRRPELDLDNDAIDIRELQQRALVKEGQLVAEILFKEPPTIGRDVFGNPVPPEPNDELVVNAGEGIIEREPGRFYAASDGIPSLDDNTLTLSKILIHDGDVNLRSGNIRFDGPVEIKGSIDSGAIVETTGDLTVFGEVRSAFVDARGNVTIKSGVTTGEKGSIYCGGDFHGEFVENSTLIVRGDLYVKKALINSKVVCGGTIKVTGKSGVLAGGTIILKENLYTSILGFSRGAVTHLNVGVDWRIARALDIRKNRLERISVKQQNDRQNLRDLVQKTKVHASPKQKALKEELQDRLTRMRAICEKLEKLILDFQSKLTFNAGVRVYVKETLMANVNLTVGGQLVSVLNDVKNVCILAKRRRGSFIAPLEEIEQEEKDQGGRKVS